MLKTVNVTYLINLVLELPIGAARMGDVSLLATGAGAMVPLVVGGGGEGEEGFAEAVEVAVAGGGFCSATPITER